MIPFTILLLHIITFCSGSDLCADNSIYDFVIVGAGTSGSILASRLSENIDWNILLLESEFDYIDFDNKPTKWNLKSKKRKLNDGCALNHQILNTGTYQKDFDDWERGGCTNWDFRSVAQYFQYMHDYIDRELLELNFKHILYPLHIRSLEPIHPLVGMFNDAFQEFCLANLEEEQKLSFEFEYVDGTNSLHTPVARRQNLHIARNVLVHKVLFQSSTKKATGVKVTSSSGKTCTVRAGKEIILSLGAIASAKILMLSGVGPAHHLKDMKIPPVADLPVGENYQDYHYFPGLLLVDTAPSEPELNTDMLSELELKTEKFMKTIHMMKTFTHVPLESVNDTTDFRLMAVNVDPASLRSTDSRTLHNIFGISDKFRSICNQWPPNAQMTFIMLIATNSKIEGYLRLNSKNPQDQLKIFQKLANSNGVNILLNAVRIIQELLTTNAFREHIIMNYIFENCKEHEKDSDEYWICLINEHTLVTSYHLTGTVRMGAEHDTSAVLNPRLQVKGVQNLRVVDKSSMPKLTSYDPCAMEIILAEKAADIIKEDYGLLGNDENGHLNKILKVIFHVYEIITFQIRRISIDILY